MPEINVTTSDVDALATKLESMNDQFSEHEFAALEAVFALAGTAVHNATSDVEGFAVDAFQPVNFSLNFTSQPGGLPGAFQGGVGGVNPIGAIGGFDHKGGIKGEIKGNIVGGSQQKW